MIQTGVIILGIGVGCWMYSFVNHRWNDQPWASSKLFFWLGLAAVACGLTILLF